VATVASAVVIGVAAELAFFRFVFAIALNRLHELAMCRLHAGLSRLLP